MTVEPPEILRPGFVTCKMLEEVLGSVETDAAILEDAKGLAPKAPGMKYRHYAPKGELTIVSGNRDKVISYINSKIKEEKLQGRKTGVIGTVESVGKYCADVIKSAGSREDELSAAKRLYGILREFDEENVEVMYSEAFAESGIGQAVMNRLLKAAGHHVVKL